MPTKPASSTRRRQARPDDDSRHGSGICFLAAGALAGALAAVLGLPGVAAVWCGAMVWLATRPAPVLSKTRDGKKVPADDAEQARLDRHRLLRRLRRHAGFVSQAWLPGWPPTGTWLAAMLAGTAGWLLPAAWWWVRPVNGLAVFALLSGWQAVSASVGVDTPGLRVTALPRSFRGRAGIVQTVSAASGGLAGMAAVWVMVTVVVPAGTSWHTAARVWLAGHAGWLIDRVPAGMLAPTTTGWPWWLTVAVAAGVLAGGWHRWLRAGLGDWHAARAADQVWAGWFAQLKLDPPPRLLSRQMIGPATVDLFEAPPAKGAADIIKLGPRLEPFCHPARPVVLECPQDGADGQPAPGTVSPTRFRIVCWPDTVDISDPQVPDEQARLWLESCAAWAGEQAGIGHPLLTGLTPVTWHPDGPARQPAMHQLAQKTKRFTRKLSGRRTTSDSANPDDSVNLGDSANSGDSGDSSGSGGGRLDQLTPDSPDNPGSPDGRESSGGQESSLAGSPVRVWQCWWVWQQADAAAARSGWRDPMADELGCPVLVDHRADTVFLGPVDHDDVVWADAQMGEAARRLTVEDQWLDIWFGVLKQGTNPPTIDHDVYTEAALTSRDDGPVVCAQPFIIRQGDNPAGYFGLEPNLATAIQQTSFTHVLGFPDPNGSRPGSRHAQAVVVAWSRSPMPTVSQLPGTGDPDGNRIVLSAHVAAAFGDHGLDQPEIVSAARVNEPGQPGIWKIRLRLYGKTTVETLRKKVEPVRASLNVDWLRIVPDADGLVTLACGADPADGRLRLSPRARAEVASYDVAHAFSVAGCHGAGGALPEVVEAGPLPGNDRVTAMLMQIPPGLTLTMLRKVRDTLKSPLGKNWIDIEPVPDDARRARMLAADQDPLPTTAGYPFDTDVAARQVGLGVDLAGQPVVADIDQVAHVIVAGASGSGKSGSTRALLAGALLAGGRVAVVDEGGQGVDYQFARPWLAGIVCDVLQAEALLQTIVADGNTRLDQMAAAGVDHASKLVGDAAVAPVFVFVDELLTLVGATTGKPESQPESDPELEAARLHQMAVFEARRRCAALVGQLTSQMRKCDIHVVAVNQAFRQDAMPPGMQDLKTNSNRLLLGSTSFPERQAALRNPDQAPEVVNPAPKGRAVWEPMQGASQTVQLWFAEPDEYTAAFAARLPELADQDGFDWRPHLRTPATSEFQIIDDTTTSSSEDTGGEADGGTVENLDWTALAPPDDTTGDTPGDTGDIDTGDLDADTGGIDPGGTDDDAAGDNGGDGGSEDTGTGGTGSVSPGVWVTGVTDVTGPASGKQVSRPGEGQGIAAR